MRNIRHSVFETNSSSTHSISINHDIETLDSLPVDKDGKLFVHFGEYGWEIEDYSDPESKLTYAATFVFSFKPTEGYNSEGAKFNKYKEMLEKVLKEQTGAKEIVYDEPTDSWSPYGYIDHQSTDVPEEAFESLETLRNFIFNPKSYFQTDNDNH